MKILHITEALGGGVYTYFKDLCYFFSNDEFENEFETIVIYNDKRNEIIPEKIQNDFGKKIKLIKVNMVKELNPFQDFISTIKLAKIIRDIKPDVIHLHSSKASVIGRCASFLSFRKHKLFYTPHGYSFLRKDISPLKQKLFKNIEKYTQNIFGGVTIACGDTEFEIAKDLGKSKLVRNGINLSLVEKHYKPIHNEKLTFGIVGRITAQKDPITFNNIAIKFPQYNFLWIGDGDLRNLITASNIKITGWLYSSNQVYEYLNRIDVFLQTSLWEGLPIAPLEGLAFRKPIISTNVIGNKDIVENNYNGFIFENLDELKYHFIFLENEINRNKMKINAYNSVKNKFDNQKNFYELIKIYS